MFKSSWTIGKFSGIPIRLHISLLLGLPIFAMIFANNVRSISPQGEMALAYLIGLFLAIGLFVSVALHEIGHSLVARSKGHKIRDITLMLIGGVAHMEDMSEDPSHELPIALMGPLVSLFLGFSLLLIRNMVPVNQVILNMFLGYLGQINIFLAVFNLLPAFPTDGGRVLRAILARRTSFLNATRIAVSIGQGFAIFFGIVGFMSGNFFLMLIALFIFMTGSQEYQSKLLQSTLAGFRIADLMTEKVVTIDVNMTVADLLDTMYKERHTGYPVQEQDAIVGCVTMEDIKKVTPQERGNSVVADIMSRELHKLRPNDDVIEALKLMSKHGIGRLFVFEGEKLAGIITRSDIIKAFQLRQIGEEL